MLNWLHVKKLKEDIVYLLSAFLCFLLFFQLTLFLPFIHPSLHLPSALPATFPFPLIFLFLLLLILFLLVLSLFPRFCSHCSTLWEVVIVKGKVGTQCAVNVTGFLFGTLNTHTWIYTVYPHTDINTEVMPPCFLFAGWSQADAWRAQSQIWNGPQQREWDNAVFQCVAFEMCLICSF